MSACILCRVDMNGLSSEEIRERSGIDMQVCGWCAEHHHTTEQAHKDYITRRVAEREAEENPHGW